SLWFSVPSLDFRLSREYLVDFGLRRRQRRGFGALRGVIELGVNGLAQFFELRFGQRARGDELFFQPADRIAPLPLLDLFALAVSRSRIAAEMAVPAIGQAFEQRRPAAAPRLGGGLRGFVVDELRVVAVDRLALEAVAGGALGEML